MNIYRASLTLAQSGAHRQVEERYAHATWYFAEPTPGEVHLLAEHLQTSNFSEDTDAAFIDAHLEIPSIVRHLNFLAERSSNFPFFCIAQNIQSQLVENLIHQRWLPARESSIPAHVLNVAKDYMAQAAASAVKPIAWRVVTGLPEDAFFRMENAFWNSYRYRILRLGMFLLFLLAMFYLYLSRP